MNIFCIFKLQSVGIFGNKNNNKNIQSKNEMRRPNFEKRPDLSQGILGDKLRTQELAKELNLTRQQEFSIRGDGKYYILPESKLKK